MAKWLLIVALALLPIPTLIFGLSGINFISVAFLLVIWIFAPSLGGWLYTACWVNLVGMRLCYTKRAGPYLDEMFTLTVAEQNRASTLLIILGLIGAIRSGLQGNIIGILLGLVSAVILFLAQPTLFHYIDTRPLLDSIRRKATKAAKRQRWVKYD